MDVRFFVSYSHEDAIWFREGYLIPQLKREIEQNGGNVWIDEDRLHGGSAHPKDIEQAIAESHVAILLVSRFFLISPFINDVELPAIRKRAEKDPAFRVICILVGKIGNLCMPFEEQFLHLPKGTKPLIEIRKEEAEWDSARVEIHDSVIRTLEEVKAYQKLAAAVPVPSVIGMTQEEAERAMKAVGLMVGLAAPEYSEQVSEGQIIRTTPEGATRVAPGSTVTFMISKGPQPVPLRTVSDGRKWYAIAAVPVLVMIAAVVLHSTGNRRPAPQEVGRTSVQSKSATNEPAESGPPVQTTIVEKQPSSPSLSSAHSDVAVITLASGEKLDADRIWFRDPFSESSMATAGQLIYDAFFVNGVSEESSVANIASAGTFGVKLCDIASIDIFSEPKAVGDSQSKSDIRINVQWKTGKTGEGLLAEIHRDRGVYLLVSGVMATSLGSFAQAAGIGVNKWTKIDVSDASATEEIKRLFAKPTAQLDAFLQINVTETGVILRIPWDYIANMEPTSESTATTAPSSLKATSKVGVAATGFWERRPHRTARILAGDGQALDVSVGLNFEWTDEWNKNTILIEPLNKDAAQKSLKVDDIQSIAVIPKRPEHGNNKFVHVVTVSGEVFEGHLGGNPWIDFVVPSHFTDEQISNIFGTEGDFPPTFTVSGTVMHAQIYLPRLQKIEFLKTVKSE